MTACPQLGVSWRIFKVFAAVPLKTIFLQEYSINADFTNGWCTFYFVVKLKLASVRPPTSLHIFLSFTNTHWIDQTHRFFSVKKYVLWNFRLLWDKKLFSLTSNKPPLKKEKGLDIHKRETTSAFPYKKFEYVCACVWACVGACVY